MGTPGFDLGVQSMNQQVLEGQRVANEQKLARQAKLSAIIGDSLNALPLPKDENGNPDINNPVYNDIMQRRQKLIGSLMDEYTPVQHANIVQRIGGLITGNKQHAMPHPDQALPAMGTGPAALAAQAGGEQAAQAQQDLQASDPNQIPQQPVENLPLHPMAPVPANHPLHAITAGIKTLGEGLKNHAQAFAHPDIKKPDHSELINNIASSYADPQQLQFERNQKLWEQRGLTAEEVARIRSQYNLLNTPEKARLDSGAKSMGYDNFPTAPPDVQDTLLRQYKTATRAPTKNIVVDPSSPTGYSAAEWDTGTGQAVSYFPGVLPPRGFVPTHRATTSVDAFGTVTHSVSDISPDFSKSGSPAAPVSSAAPSVPSSATAPKAASPLATVNAQIAAGNATSPKLNKGKPVSAAAPAMPTGTLPPLDSDGHIPEGVGNDLARQYANNLLDGMAAKDIPNPRARAAAEAMAGRYGWSQGAFLPREKVQFQVATDFLKQLQDSKSLSVLDSYVSREKLAHALEASGPKGGMLDRLAAYNLNGQEAEFLRLYNAALGTVQGLASITRSGKSTEAAVNRLKTELPNVLQSPSSDDARKRIDQLLKEANIALGTNPMNVGKGGTQKFTENGTVYNIPASDVAEFKKDHPNAR